VLLYQRVAKNKNWSTFLYIRLPHMPGFIFASLAKPAALAKSSSAIESQKPSELKHRENLFICKKEDGKFDGYL